MIGPGYYEQAGFDQAMDSQGANATKGIFSRTTRNVPENRNPGPGAYQKLDLEAIGQREQD